MFKHLDPSIEIKKRSKKPISLFDRNNKNKTLSEHALRESDGFINAFSTLAKSIEVSDYKSLYNEFIGTCVMLKEKLQQIESRCKDSYDLLDSGSTKNSLQEFKIWEYSSLYSRYIQFKCLMKLIQQSSLARLTEVEESPYLPLSHIVYFGANIDMINDLICKTVFSFNE
jgi:hypothetical protein